LLKHAHLLKKSKFGAPVKIEQVKDGGYVVTEDGRTLRDTDREERFDNSEATFMEEAIKNALMDSGETLHASHKKRIETAKEILCVRRESSPDNLKTFVGEKKRALSNVEETQSGERRHVYRKRKLEVERPDTAARGGTSRIKKNDRTDSSTLSSSEMKRAKKKKKKKKKKRSDGAVPSLLSFT